MTKTRNAAQSQTMYFLMTEHGAKTLIPLEDIAFTVLGLSVNAAKTKAKRQLLPFAVTRMYDSQKAPWVVHIQDLAA